MIFGGGASKRIIDEHNLSNGDASKDPWKTELKWETFKCG